MNKELAKWFYSDMHKIRRFEQEAFEFYKTGQMAGLAYLHIGKEAVTAGACAAIEAQDYIASTHREHGHLVARGVDMGRMMAEILGKEMGYSRSKGGSMHIMAIDLGVLDVDGTVGGGIPMATGAGHSTKYRGTDQVTLRSLGDGAANEDTLRESINMAVVWDLPVVYVIENNLYGITVDSRRVTKEHDLAKWITGYGILGYTIDGSDVEAVYKTMQKAVKHIREGKGPSIVECKTYRHYGYNGSDSGIYHPPEGVKAREAKDPLILSRGKGYLTEKERKEIEDKVEQEVQATCKFVAESPYPEAPELMDNIFCD